MIGNYKFQRTPYKYKMISSFISPFGITGVMTIGNSTIPGDMTTDEWTEPEWPYFTTNFYISGYVCPKCGSLLLKTVFPEDLSINTVNGTKRIPRIFTCGKCLTFYAPEPGYKLADANGYVLELDDPEEYEKLLYEFDRRGSAQGRRGTVGKSRW